jgi:hypothetical protein
MAALDHIAISCIVDGTGDRVLCGPLGYCPVAIDVLSGVSFKNQTLACTNHVKVKVKQSRYRPGVAQRVPGS